MIDQRQVICGVHRVFERLRQNVAVSGVPARVVDASTSATERQSRYSARVIVSSLIVRFIVVWLRPAHHIIGHSGDDYSARIELIDG